MFSLAEKNIEVASPASEEIEYAGARADDHERNLVYEDDEEPKIHAQTYFALAAMFFLNLVQVFGLMGPPAAVTYPYSINSSYLISLTTHCC